MRFPRTQARRGAVAVLVAFGLVAIVGVAAVIIDGGLLRDNRRKVQASADAAALAAASDLYTRYATNAGKDPTNDAATSALATAASNGYTNDTTNSVVTVNIPPATGAFTGKPGYVEVVIEFKQQRGFSGIFGQGTLPVRARSVARGAWTTFRNGIVVLDPDDPSAFNANGGAKVEVKGASININSSAQNGTVATGGGTIKGDDIYMAGSPGWSTSGGSTITGNLHSNSTPLSDPLAYLPQPNPDSMSIRGSNNTHMSAPKTYVLEPGVYKGGITISGQANVTMLPGIYYMDGGGFSYIGQGDLTAYEVMIYNAPQNNSDVIDISGQGAVNITPPTTGLYAGISIFQERTSTNTVSITGLGSMYVTGTFYVSGGLLKVTGNGVANVIGAQYISNLLNLGGNGEIFIDWNASPTARLRQVGLVE
jgi:Flp pilus assembly protein TadG